MNRSVEDVASHSRPLPVHSGLRGLFAIYVLLDSLAYPSTTLQHESERHH
jgi:hypothetical protein